MLDNINKCIDGIKFFLNEKNKKYGNSALKPINIFSKTNNETGLLQRIDDKLMRIKTADSPKKNDVADLIGYLILYSVQQDWTDFTDLLD